MILRPASASRFRSDGGAMFGLVPKVLWSKLQPADEKNTIAQSASVLLVELDDGRKGIIDSGCGNPADFSERELAINGIPDTSWLLMDAVHDIGWTADIVDFLILSHLHWDHAGGAFHGETNEMSFPNATYYVNGEEVEDALSGDPILHKSYPPPVVMPFKDMPAKQLVIVESPREEILPGIIMEQVGGHTRGQCILRLTSPTLELKDTKGNLVDHEAKEAVFTADACPTRHHLRLVFQTAFDLYPLGTRRWKQKALPEFSQNQTLIFFDHDPEVYAGTITMDGADRFTVTPVISSI